ncbi:YkgJ family cysteine cluster protein [Candidatus Thorarchaeota archaeon]|nr:MAG: YkgJ family cysteine cluster protein [Candidatus Thorarchaeota archaeon]
MVDNNHSNICKRCGGYCCKLGGTLATKSEVDRIIAAGYPNQFIEITENCYVTDFGKELVCPYLKDSTCEIYHIRPLLCQKYPIFSTDGEEHFLVHCPLTQHLSKDDLTQCIEAALEVPEEIFTSIQRFMAPFGSKIDGRMRKFRMEPIVLE